MLELKAQQIELGTRVCTDLADVEKELRFWRSRAESAAAGVGAHVAALATSPVDVVPVPTEGERYARIVDAFARTARDVLTCGCHVHVSIADAEEGVEVLNRIRVWLPVLTALTANSPFWHGEDTGYASYRSQVWLRWPTAGPNEPFADAAAYHRLVDDVLATGTVLDRGGVYFDARLSAKWPTVEVRTPDVALRAEDAVTLAGIVRGLVETAAREARDGKPVAGRAQRDAAGRDLAGRAHRPRRRPRPPRHRHPRTGRGGRWAPWPTTCDRPSPTPVTTRCVDAGLAALLRRGTGADLQRAVYQATGDPAAVVRAAVAVTAGADGDTARATPGRSG